MPTGFSAFGAGVDVEVTFVDTEAFDTAAIKKDKKIIQAAELISYEFMVSDHKIECHSLKMIGVRSAAGELIAQESSKGACNKDWLTDEVSDDLNGEDQATVENMAVAHVVGALGEEFMLKEVRRNPCLRVAMNGSEKHNG